MILGSFRETVRANSLLSPGDRVLAAVSGGGDSVALLLLLSRVAEEIPLTVVVAHINHRLRGIASDQDQRFVEELAARLGRECLVLTADAEGQSGVAADGEEALRSVRHALLRRAAKQMRCSKIAMAHTMDDQAETFLMRLIRGAGRRGLSAMAPAGPGPLIRPMLGITRSQTRAWLAGVGQGYREDETNLSSRYLRNRVRGRLLPAMTELNPSIVPRLARTAELLRDEDRYLDALAAEWIERSRRSGTGPGLALPARDDEGIGGLPAALGRRIVRLALEEAGGDPRGARQAVVAAVLRFAVRGTEGEPLRLARGMEARIEGADLVMTRSREGRSDSPARLRRPDRIAVDLPIPGRARGTELGGEMEARVVARREAGEDRCGAGRVCLDAALLGQMATVRVRQPGDTFHPLGAPGHRKLSDFLIDRKVPRNKRDCILLVVGPVGIAWVVGERIGHPYRLTESTRSVAVLEYRPMVDHGEP